MGNQLSIKQNVCVFFLFMLSLFQPLLFLPASFKAERKENSSSYFKLKLLLEK